MRRAAGVASFEPVTLLLIRLLTGAFLIHGVWDNITDPARMAEFVGFLRAAGFPRPELMAPLSVAAQFASGAGFVTGLFTRAAGLLCAANFTVAVAMVHWNEDFRAWWPAIVLVAIGLHLAARGGGRFSLDTALGRSGS